MNEKLVRFLESNRAVILSEWKTQAVSDWNSRLAANSLFAGVGTTKIPSSASICSHRTADMLSFLVKGFYSDLLKLVQGENINKTKSSGQQFPRYTPYGVRLTLPYLLEIFFAGEEVFGNHLLLDNKEENGFSHTEASDAFEEVSDAFRLLIQHYVDVFCIDCLVPLTTAVKSVMDEFQATENAQKEIYDQKK